MWELSEKSYKDKWERRREVQDLFNPKKKYLGNVDYRYEKFFKSKKYWQCGTEQVGKAFYMTGTEGMETHPRLKKRWFIYDFIAWRWNKRSDKSGELESYKKALTEIQKREK